MEINNVINNSILMNIKFYINNIENNKKLYKNYKQTVFLQQKNKNLQ